MLPFAESELLAVRLLPAEFARACRVSKQCVSKWVRNGKVTLGCDGRLDPNEAMRQLLRTTDPGRIRARFLKAAVADLDALRAAAALAEERERELAFARERIKFLESRLDEAGDIEEAFKAMLIANAAELRASDDAGFARLLDEILDRAILASCALAEEEGGEGAG